MNDPTPTVSRRLVPVVIGVAFVLITVIALAQIVQFRSQLRTRETARLEAELRAGVASLEDRLQADIEAWMADAAMEPERAGRLQDRWRRERPWFDSVYVWQRTPERPFSLEGPAVRFLFPAPALVEDRQIVDGCISAAEAARATSEVHDIAALYVAGCKSRPLPVRLVAATEAATLLHQAHDHAAALQALAHSDVPADLGLTEGIGRGIAPWRIATLRLLRGQILMSLGRVDEGLQYHYQVGLEIAALDAPQAEALLGLVQHRTPRQLRANGHRQQADQLDLLLGRAARRVEVWGEVRDRIVEPARVAPVTTGSRFIYDQYSDTPWLLFYDWSPTGQIGVALQLEQAALVEEMLNSSALRPLRPWITITDPAGQWVAGVRRGGQLVVSVPFTRTLTHLRVGIRQEALESTLVDLRSQWLTPLLVVGIFSFLGVAALYAQLKASQQQAALLARQREFTTRVTHELKTPLAGIRVMAENLESGAWSDDRQVRVAASRIITEADRLTARVDQVLAVARTRSIPRPEPFDPEESLLSAVDDWGPRLEAAGVKLLADLHPTDPIVGDAGAIQDAVACLLDNALKYKRDDRPDPMVWLLASQQGRWVEISVTDNGLGVPPKMRSSIFERFVRVEGPNRGTAGGHGLGLSQVREIVEAHGGTVVCTEGVDGGARFTLRLPVDRAAS